MKRWLIPFIELYILHAPVRALGWVVRRVAGVVEYMRKRGRG